MKPRNASAKPDGFPTEAPASLRWWLQIQRRRFLPQRHAVKNRVNPFFRSPVSNSRSLVHKSPSSSSVSAT